MKTISLKYHDVINTVKDNRENLAERYKKDEEILKQSINKELYLKADLDYIYFISTLINSFYSTRMGGDRLFEVAKFISNYPNVTTTQQVIDIINLASKQKFQINKKSKEYGANSFLSKYYALHNRIAFHDGIFSEIPILDTRVKQAIRIIINTVKSSARFDNNYSAKFIEEIKQYKCKDCENYEKLFNIITIICNEINLNKPEKDIPTNYTTIDNYFWGLTL